MQVRSRALRSSYRQNFRRFQWHSRGTQVADRLGGCGRKEVLAEVLLVEELRMILS